MATIHHEVEINAAPSAVFDLISKVEDFCLYTRYISEISRIGPDRYHWRVSMGGARLEWDVVVTENIRPECFAWRSTSGIANSGCYRLTPTQSGTLVALSIEYQLANPTLERIINPMAKRLTRKVAAEIMGNIRQRLEHADPQAKPQPPLT